MTIHIVLYTTISPVNTVFHPASPKAILIYYLGPIGESLSVLWPHWPMAF